MFRPHNMLWVDLLVDRDAAHRAIELLAASRIIELRAYDRAEMPFDPEQSAGISERLIAVDEKFARYRKYVPATAPAADRPQSLQPTAEVLPEIETRAAFWLDDIEAPAAELERATSLLEDYRVLEGCLSALPASEYDLGYFVSLSRSRLYCSFIALGKPADRAFFGDVQHQVLYSAYPLIGDDEQVVFIGVVDVSGMRELERAGHAHGIRFLSIPAEITGPPASAVAQLREVIDATTRRCEGLRSGIDAINAEHEIGRVLRLLSRHLWANGVLQNALTGTRFVWLGGWIPEGRYGELLRTLEQGGVPFLVNRDTAHQHGPPPALLNNPRWMKSFEIFARGFGMPRESDVDPTPLLALTTPIMFGYMFGDVGHGMVLVVAGWFLRRRFPFLVLLLPAGAVSIAFGLAFGSVFCNEHLIPALWLHPMAEPLTVLALPLVFGFVFLSVGLVLSGLQARWRAASRGWWLREFALVLIYCVAMPIGLLDWRLGIAIALLGVFWFVTGSAILAHLAQTSLVKVLASMASGFVELLELAVQLLINTLSFARLGAFALAHSGLSAAVIALAALAESVWLSAFLLIVGNAVVIALEGLVVSIQTTRLVMFEFFRRFYAGEGTGFTPLSLPGGEHSVSGPRSQP